MNNKPAWIPAKDRGDRDSLHSLPLDKTFLIQGKFSCEMPLRNPAQIRFVLEDVIIREYDKEVLVEDSNVVGFAKHVTIIRKRQNTEYIKMQGGTYLTFVGKVDEYKSLSVDHAGRRTVKVFVDSNIKAQFSTVVKRLQALEQNWENWEPEFKFKHTQKTLKALERVENIVEEFFWVPFITLSDARSRVSNIKKKVQEIRERDEMATFIGLDSILKSI